MLDTRWEQINWLDDIKHAPSTRQLDNGEDRLEGKQEQLTEQWTGQTRDDITHQVQESCLQENAEFGLEGK